MNSENRGMQLMNSENRGRQLINSVILYRTMHGPAGMVDAASRFWMQELKCLERYHVLVATERMKIFFKDLLIMLKKKIPKL